MRLPITIANVLGLHPSPQLLFPCFVWGNSSQELLMRGALKLHKGIARLLQEETPPKRFTQCLAHDSCQQRDLPSVCLVPQVSSVFCQPHNRYHKRVTLGHTLIQPLARSLVQKSYKQCVVGSACQKPFLVFWGLDFPQVKRYFSYSCPASPLQQD